jgi:signal transduction histidine kinase
MSISELKTQLNVFKQCKKYRVPLWECPQFLFVLMGIFIIIVILVTYFIGIHYIRDPLLIAFIVLILAIVLLSLAYLVVQSFERMAEASRMKSEFIQIVSHQLRNPLSNLSWVVDLLSSNGQKMDIKKRGEFYNLLKSNIQRMNELINDLILVAKIERKETPLNISKVSLEQLIMKTISNLQPALEKKEISLTFSKSGDIPSFIKTDVSKLKIILENLIENAIKYTPPKGRIEISLEGRKGKIIFRIKDNGIGIPKEDQKLIFKKFYRSDKAQEMETQGIGLGLYIVKSFVDQLKGKIYFYSQFKKGTTFVVEIPR